MLFMKAICLIVVCFGACSLAASVREASVYYVGPDVPPHITLDKLDTKATAWGRVEDTRYTVGWDKMDLWTSPTASEDMQTYAAGYFEGYMLQDAIWSVWNNFVYRMLKGKPPAQELLDYARAQMAWTRKMVAANRKTDAFWRQIGVLMSQFDGLRGGYRDAAPADKTLKDTDFWLFQSSGDLYDLIPALVPHMRINWTTLDAETFAREHEERMSCSALIRVTDNNQDIITSHNTWTDFGSMVRTYKVINTNLNVTGANRWAFSSKPSLLYSKDDFYVLESGLVVLETTNGVLDESLYKFITPESLLTWQRVPVCNRMSTTGPEWIDCMERYSSGTYGNQWQIVDYKLFRPGQPLKPNTIWILEQVPGYSDRSDVTARVVAQGGYWPSYNVPASEKIYNISGYYAAWQTKGDDYSYTKCARAQLFARDHKKVNSLEDMKKIMQYNDYKNDPLSKGSPKNAIASRYDLLEKGASPFGAIDAKITSASAVPELQAWAISGPTKDNQVPWTWTDKYKEVTHMGEPDTFNFDWQVYTPAHA